MYGWAGFGINGPMPDEYPVAGRDYDPALLGQAVVFPQEDIGPVGGDPRTWSPVPGAALPAPSATQWLNANAGKVALGVGGFVALIMLAKAGR